MFGAPSKTVATHADAVATTRLKYCRAVAARLRVTAGRVRRVVFLVSLRVPLEFSTRVPRRNARNATCVFRGFFFFFWNDCFRRDGFGLSINIAIITSRRVCCTITVENLNKKKKKWFVFSVTTHFFTLIIE